MRKGAKNATDTYKKIIKHEQDIHYFGQFFTLITLAVLCYMFLLELVADKIAQGTDSIYYTIAILIVVCCVFSIMIYKGPYSFALYGLTTKGAKKAIYEALITTLPILLLFTLAKFIVLQMDWYPPFRNTDFFMLYRNHSDSVYTTITIALMYLISVLTQEFFTRGVIQSALMHFFTGKYANVNAIILTTMIAAANHLHLSTRFALLVIIPSLYWSILYARSRTLIGVCCSHAMIGIYAIFILGIQ